MIYVAVNYYLSYKELKYFGYRNDAGWIREVWIFNACSDYRT